jgi:hypothetical protein
MEEKIILELIIKLTESVGELTKVVHMLNTRVSKLELNKTSSNLDNR